MAAPASIRIVSDAVHESTVATESMRLPMIHLTSTTSPAPIKGLMVYNTNGTLQTGTRSNIWYGTGSAWVPLDNAS